jgi:hypothetical protein
MLAGRVTLVNIIIMEKKKEKEIQELELNPFLELANQNGHSLFASHQNQVSSGSTFGTIDKYKYNSHSLS